MFGLGFVNISCITAGFSEVFVLNTTMRLLVAGKKGRNAEERGCVQAHHQSTEGSLREPGSSPYRITVNSSPFLISLPPFFPPFFSFYFLVLFASLGMGTCR